MKNYLKSRHITIKELSNKTGIAYSTLNDLVSGKISAENCRAGVVKRLSEALDLNMDDIYELLLQKRSFIMRDEYIEYRIYAVNKKYYASVDYLGESKSFFLSKQKKELEPWILEVGEHKIMDYINQLQIDALTEDL